MDPWEFVTFPILFAAMKGLSKLALFIATGLQKKNSCYGKKKVSEKGLSP